MSAQAAPRGRLTGQVLRFAATGLLNTGFGLAVILALHLGLGLGVLAANALGYGAGIALSFLLNRRWTFGHAGPAWPSLWRFAAVLAVAFVASMGVLAGLGALGLPYLAAQVAGVLVYSLIGFFGMRHVAFATT